MLPEHFPAMEEVEKADRLQIAKWYQFLPKNEVGSHQNIYGQDYRLVHEYGWPDAGGLGDP